MRIFNFKNKKNCTQETFVKLIMETFSPLFFRYGFQLISKEHDNSSSKLVFKKAKKYILILSEQNPRDGNYFELTIGNSFDYETNSFDDYYITVNRLYKIINKRGKDFYDFPSSERQAIKDIQKAKNDFLKCASFYLETDKDLFDTVLKLKGIR